MDELINEELFMDKLITIISGSPRYDNSISLRRAIEIAEKTGYQYRVFSAANWNVIACKGCSKCFAKGYCVMRDSDDVGTIIDAMKSAAAIIFASPVYVGSISGQLKILIDRLAVLHHILPFIGIPALSVVVASNNHLEETADYLNSSIEYMGASLVDSVKIARLNPSENDIIEKASNSLKNAIEGEQKLIYSGKQHKLFHYYNKRYSKMLSLLDDFPDMFGEANEWNKLGYIDCLNIDDASDRYRYSSLR